MSKGATKQVNFSLHLRPDTSKADERVIAWLKQWHDGLKQNDDNRNDANMEIRTFHRNVYLAGLQLQLLDPQLCNAIAESIGREELTLAELVGKLVRDKLLPEGTPMAASTPAYSDAFTAEQLSQLKQLLGEQKAETPNGNSDQQVEFQRMRDELAKLKAVLDQQTRLLQQLSRPENGASATLVAKDSGAEESELSSLSAPTEKMQKIKQKGIF